MSIIEERAALPPGGKTRTRRQRIVAAVSDLVGELMYYGRKEDEDLPLDAIQAAVEADEISVDEMVELFAHELRGCFGEKSATPSPSDQLEHCRETLRQVGLATLVLKGVESMGHEKAQAILRERAPWLWDEPARRKP